MEMHYKLPVCFEQLGQLLQIMLVVRGKCAPSRHVTCRNAIVCYRSNHFMLYNHQISFRSLGTSTGDLLCCGICACLCGWETLIPRGHLATKQAAAVASHSSEFIYIAERQAGKQTNLHPGGGQVHDNNDC